MEIAFGNVVISTVLILPTHAHERRFHLLVFYFFFSVFCNCTCRHLSPSSLNLFLGILLFFYKNAIVNEIVFLISFSEDSLSVYRKFCYFVSSGVLLVNNLGSCRYKIILSANRDNLTSFIPTCILLSIPFSYSG